LRHRWFLLKGWRSTPKLKQRYGMNTFLQYNLSWQSPAFNSHLLSLLHIAIFPKRTPVLYGQEFGKNAYDVSIFPWICFVACTPQAEWDSVPGRRPPDAWPRNGHVKVDGLALRYRPELDLVLRDVSFTIQPGQKVKHLTILFPL
jgi:ABC-type multidrug transport system fused ATPase/permease subunit